MSIFLVNSYPLILVAMDFFKFYTSLRNNVATKHLKLTIYKPTFVNFNLVGFEILDQ